MRTATLKSERGHYESASGRSSPFDGKTHHPVNFLAVPSLRLGLALAEYLAASWLPSAHRL